MINNFVEDQSFEHLRCVTANIRNCNFMKRFLGFMQNNRGHFPSASNQSGFKKPVASYKLLNNGYPEIPVPQTCNFFQAPKFEALLLWAV